MTNPRVLVEVLSPTTEKYDREEKFAHYRRIPSLGAYVLVSQMERRGEVFTRAEDGTWILRDVLAGTADIAPIHCTLQLETCTETRSGECSPDPRRRDSLIRVIPRRLACLAVDRTYPGEGVPPGVPPRVSGNPRSQRWGGSGTRRVRGRRRRHPAASDRGG